MPRNQRNREEMMHEIHALRRALKKAHMLLASNGIPTFPMGWGTSFSKSKEKKTK